VLGSLLSQGSNSLGSTGRLRSDLLETYRNILLFRDPRLLSTGRLRSDLLETRASSRSAATAFAIGSTGRLRSDLLETASIARLATFCGSHVYRSPSIGLIENAIPHPHCAPTSLVCRSPSIKHLVKRSILKALT
jgi:hypothetical protein